MKQEQILRSKLLQESLILKLGPKSKSLLNYFTEYDSFIEDPQEAFIEAAQKAGLVGPDSLILASRLKCEFIIKYIFKDMKIDIEIDSFVPKLMMSDKEGK